MRVVVDSVLPARFVPLIQRSPMFALRGITGWLLTSTS
jgi:hypothetical protein